MRRLAVAGPWLVNSLRGQNMQIQVVVVEGPDRGRQFSISSGQELTIGRGLQSQTQLNDPSVSRLHCLISFAGCRATLKDCGSGSGTLLNDNSVTEAAISPGDRITLGDTQLTISIVSSANDQTIAPKRAAVAQELSAQIAPEIQSVKRNLSSLVGTTLHKYQIDTTHIRGNTGTIFRGRHVESGQLVAVKVLWPDLMANDDQMKRFVRAMKTMRVIKHPHIVRILMAGITELGTTGENFCWFAMEFVDGFSLKQLVRRVGTAGMLDWENAFRIAMQMARALEVAHERGIVHRNLTPENIIVPRSHPHAKLADLMLAKALEGSASDQITRNGELLGDIVYMSPERTRGEPIDHRSDMYSLGATLYFALTGQPPFEAASLPSLIGRIQDEDPLPPKTFQLSVNDAFQDVVMKLLAKSPDDRFEHPTRLLIELGRVGKFAGIEVP